MITSKPILLKFGSSYFKLVKYDSYCDTHLAVEQKRAQKLVGFLDILMMLSY